MARDHDCSASRRRFWLSAGAVLAAPRIALAQGSTKIRRIGALTAGLPDGPEVLSKQAEPLRQLGWVEGQNLQVERRYDNGRPAALQPLAEELVRANVEIIVTLGTSATLAAKRATTTIPIVFFVGDAVLTGVVGSLSRPGGNATGYSDASPEVTAKQLSLLKEFVPQLQRIGMLWEAGNPFNRSYRAQFERVCESLRLVPIIVEIDAAPEIELGIEELVRQRAQALVMPSNALVNDHDVEIAHAAMKHRLPTITDEAERVRERTGVLIAYSSTWAEQFRRRAEYIDRILRGAKPSELPVQQPTKFELVIDLRTARALGLTIPKKLLLRADEVIQ
jgi:putative ABC transport system substrate-binding protein